MLKPYAARDHEKMKEVFYWIFGIASIAAAIFGAWAVFK